MKNYNKLLKGILVQGEPTVQSQWVKVNVPINHVEYKNYERLVGQLDYVLNANIDNIQVKETIERIATEVICSGTKVILDEKLHEYEKEILNLIPSNKEKTIHMVSHAHIDMNWMWGFHETVTIVVDTVRTMVKLMEKYPYFTYSHSQASTYKILEEYDPKLLESLKKYIKNGQFEVTASMWTEKDTNMVSTESYIKHMTETRQYLKNLLDLSDEDFYIDFEPDTFGHSGEVPKLLGLGKIKYYYHSRGIEGQTLYRFQSSGGDEIISFCEPKWYSNAVHSICLSHIPKELNRLSINDFLYVYGVGNHGGGPTHRDILYIHEMQQWPLMPTIIFSTYKSFFTKVEKHRDTLPVVKNELNFTLTGCFTASSRMKTFNRIAETSANMTSFSDSLVTNLDLKINSETYGEEWRKILFNQFHDILPGCGTIQTYEFAAGEFQKVLAKFNMTRKQNYRLISENISTYFLGEATNNSLTAFGAGNGTNKKYMIDEGGQSLNYFLDVNCVDITNKRYFVVFNPSPYTNANIIDLMLWDFNGDVNNLECLNSRGENLKFQVMNHDYNHYWSHHYIAIKIFIECEPLSYTTIGIREKEVDLLPDVTATDPKVTYYPEIIIENETTKIRFNKQTMRIIEFSVDGDVVSNNLAFKLLTEEGESSSAWGYRRITDEEIQKSAKNVVVQKNEIFESVSFDIQFLTSTINVMYFLPCNKSQVEVQIRTKWNEVGTIDGGVPCLIYDIDVPTIDAYMNDIPGGYIKRTLKDLDIPGLSYIKLGEEEQNVYIISEEKYGYRVFENHFYHNLIRSTNCPDTHPENYEHYFRFYVGVGTFEECNIESHNINNRIECVNAPSNQNGYLKNDYKLNFDKEGFEIIKMYAIEDYIYTRFLALSDNVEFILGEDEVVVDIYENETSIKATINKFDIITIRRNKNM